MTIKKYINIDGMLYPVTISDEEEALSAAYEAGGAIIGIWAPPPPGIPDEKQAAPIFWKCLYLVTSLKELSPQLLERAARRRAGLPWLIAETSRLLIREFTSRDPIEPPSDEDGNGVFSDWEKREAYRKTQYALYEHGLWALIEKNSGRLVGKAGITGEELSYHIYPPFRRRGYAREACEKIISVARDELGLSELLIRVRKDNTASLRLAGALGFWPEKEEDSFGSREARFVLKFCE